MKSGFAAKLLAWAIALGLVALPIVGVLNGWFASERWPLTKLAVRAEFNHVSAEQIRAAAQPLLGAGFFATPLDGLRAAVAKLPWVERVEVRKRWPDTIDLVVYEQQAYARWGDDRLVNRDGGIFSVAGAHDIQGLPRLAGPDERVAEVLAFYADCVHEFSGSGLVIDAAALSPRGGWKLTLASGAVIEVGNDGVQRHLKRFLDVWPRLAGSRPTPPAAIDLRYENGFAVRWGARAAPPPNAGIGDDQPSAVVKPSGLGIREKRNARALFATSREASSPAFANPESRIPNPGFFPSPIPALP